MAEQKKIYLWSIPRSISTAMVRAMMSRENCRVSLQDEDITEFFFMTLVKFTKI